MLISVIVPIYNAEIFIERCIQSILNQSYRQIEVLLINDGSTDGSYDICRQYARRDERVRVFNQENQGQGASRNYGLKNANGTYICFVDADDQLGKGALAKYVQLLEKEDYDVVSGDYITIKDNQSRRVSPCFEGHINKYGTDDEIRRYDMYKTSSGFGYVWGKIYKKSFLLSHELVFSEGLFMEDTLFNLKVLNERPSYYYTDQPVYYYYIASGSASNQVGGIEEKSKVMLTDYLEYLEKKKTFDESLDVLLPLVIRVILWTLFKEMESSGFSSQTIKRICQGFRENSSISKSFDIGHYKSYFNGLKPTEVKLLSVVMYNLMKNRHYGLICGIFGLGYPFMKMYIHHQIKR